MPKCKQCGVSGTSVSWGRYRNGRLKVLCPDCDGQVQVARERTQAAKAAGYPCWGNTPEYKRLQLEAEAAEEGRILPPYLPQSVRTFRARMRRAETIADRIRTRWAAEWLRPFRIDRFAYSESGAAG